MPLWSKVYSLSNPLKSLYVTVPGNITPIIVTLLSVQSKLSFTLCPHSAHRPKAFTLHFFTVNSRNSFQLRKDREPDDDDHFLRGLGQLLASDMGWGFRPHHGPGTGEQRAAYVGHQPPGSGPAHQAGAQAAPLLTLVSLPGPEPGHTWPWGHDTWHGHNMNTNTSSVNTHM